MNSASLDGNAAGGAFAELFAPEVTTAVTTCSICGDTRPMGELKAFMDAPGIVLRCASCGQVEARLVRGPDRAWLDMRGVRVLEVALS